MIEIGFDIFGLLIAGALLPLSLMPLAIFIAGRRSSIATGMIWGALVALVFASAALFSALAPRQEFLMQGPFIDKVLIGALATFVIGIATIRGTTPTATNLSRYFRSMIVGIGGIVKWCLLFMALTQFGLVIARYVFGINSIFVQESITYAHATVFMLAASYTFLTDDHVRVDIFYRDLHQKKRALIDLAGTYLFLFPMCFLAIITALPYIESAWQVREGSTESSGIQALFLLKTTIIVFGVLLALAGIVSANKMVAELQEQDA